MRARRRLTGIAAALVALVAGLALASCGSDDDGPTGTTTTATGSTQTVTTTQTTTTTKTAPEPAGPTVVRVVVVNGAPRGGIVRSTVEQGERVALVVTSDVADEIHVHGYDLSRDVAAGGTARITFVARLPGRFEVELEERGAPVAELTVEP